MSTPLPLPPSPASPPRLRVIDGGREEDEADPGAVAASLDTARVRRLVAELPPLHRLVANWRFGLAGLTLGRREIAARLGLSPMLVQQIEGEALQTMRTHAMRRYRAA